MSNVNAEVKSTGVVTLFSQRPCDGQPGSPPPLTLAVLVTCGTAASVGVTGMTKLVVPPFAARPAGIVHVTLWPAAAQPAGRVLRVRLLGTTSVMVATSVVAAEPMLVTCRV